eukprot:s2744_g1.t1
MAFMFPILLASLRAIGVAVTVIVAGILATRFKVLTPPEHSCMSKLSMKVAMPALVFSRILYCNQCADRADCPRCAPFSEIIRSSWILFLLPLVVVGLGTSLGRAVAAVAEVPSDFRRGTICAVAFGNSTGMPVVLLTVVSQSMTAFGNGPIGHTDPLLHLPAYLMLYPVLQWGIGTWLLAPTADEEITLTIPPPCKGTLPRLCGAEEGFYYMGPARQALEHALVPPVLAALAGLLVALSPCRGILVDLAGQANDAPLEWLYDGIYKLGDAAVPLNLLILGSSLSQGADFEALPLRVGMAITVCKMVVMPLLMSLIVYGLIRLVDGKDPAMWLVALIVTCTPTANNVGIMTHLGGQKVESMATAIFIQYVFAPVLIAMSLTYFMWLLSSEWYLPASSV